MEKSKLDRINYLAKKKREEGLTEDEAKEQALLRREYIDSVTGGLRAQLENTVLLRPDGTREKLHKKDGDI